MERAQGDVYESDRDSLSVLDGGTRERRRIESSERGNYEEGLRDKSVKVIVSFSIE